MSQQDMDRTGCLAGCDPTPRDEAAQPTPGQLLHSLHPMGRVDQLDAARRILAASDLAMRCFTRNHEGRLARDDDERTLLLWLHAEEVWLGQQTQEAMQRALAGAHRRVDELVDEKTSVEASRRDWAAEADRLTSEINKYADVVFRRQSSPVWADLVSKLRRIASGAHGECTFVSDDGILCELDDGHGGDHLRWFDEIRYEVLTRTPDVCACLAAEQSAVVLAGGFSLPLCAVHPEADDAALLAVAEARVAADTGERHSLDDVAAEFGVDLAEPPVHPEADR